MESIIDALYAHAQEYIRTGDFPHVPREVTGAEESLSEQLRGAPRATWLRYVNGMDVVCCRCEDFGFRLGLRTGVSLVLELCRSDADPQQPPNESGII